MVWEAKIIETDLGSILHRGEDVQPCLVAFRVIEEVLVRRRTSWGYVISIARRRHVNSFATQELQDPVVKSWISWYVIPQSVRG